MSENGENEQQQGRRRGNSSEKELASQQIQIQSKRFYIDVKENQRGRYIKLAEVGAGGRKSRILMIMSAAEEFKKHLIEFCELHAQMGACQNEKDGNGDEGGEGGGKEGAGEVKEENGGGGGGGGGNGNRDGVNKDSDILIKSETFIKERKRYYMDLKENQRGRFLRVSMIVPGPRGARTQVAIPAEGLLEFKDQLVDMLERYNTLPESENNEADNLPDSKSIRADNKTFFFDYGTNQRGVFLKISEVRQNRYRTSITIPEKCLLQFSEQIKEFTERSALNKSNSNEDDDDATKQPTTKTTGESSADANSVEKVANAMAATAITQPVK